MRCLSFLAVLSLASCLGRTTLRSTPPGAQVFVSDRSVGTTPLTLAPTSDKIRVEQQGRSVEFFMKTHPDWSYALANTATACLLSASIVACIGGSLWALGTTLSLAAPVLTPIFAICGAPPAACGTALWSGVFGLGGAALVLPFQAFFNSSAGPQLIEVDLSSGAVRSTPPRQFVLERSESLDGGSAASADH